MERGPDGLPVAIRIWRDGANDSDEGPVYLTDAGRSEVMARFAKRGMPLRWDYNHESTIPIEERKASLASGFGVGAGDSRLALRGKELWAEGIKWTPMAAARIRSRELTQVSPYFHVNEAREIDELYNMALCFEGKTHHGVSLAAWARLAWRNVMNELIAQMEAALAAGDLEQAAAILARMKEIGGGGAMAEGAGMGQGAEEKIAAEVEAGMSRAMARLPKPATSSGADLAMSRGEITMRGVGIDLMARDAARDGLTLTPETVRHYKGRGDIEGFEVLVGEVRKHARQAPPTKTTTAKEPSTDSEATGIPANLTAADIVEAEKTGISLEKMSKVKAGRAARVAARKGG